MSASQIIQHIQDRLSTEDHQVTLSHVDSSAAITALQGVTFLSMRTGQVTVRRNQPFRADLWPQFESAVAAHPEWQNDTDEAMKWIVAQLNWENDLLGQYSPGDAPTIDLFWLAIILCARQYSVTITDVVLVVLLHEWAHAFNDRGQDADGRSGSLSKDIHVCEGLAQLWTQYALKRSNISPTAYQFFLRLLKDQPIQYQAHIPWLDATTFADCEAAGFQKRQIGDTRRGNTGLVLHSRLEAVRHLRRFRDMPLNEFDKAVTGIDFSDPDSVLTGSIRDLCDLI